MQNDSRTDGCICGPDIRPNTVFKVKNDYCGGCACQDPERKRTLTERNDAKSVFQSKIREQEITRPEIHRKEEADAALQREANKASYKQALYEARNYLKKDFFHVCDMRKYPKQLDEMLPTFLTKVQPSSDDSSKPQFPFDEADVCTCCQEKLTSKIKREGVLVRTPCSHYFHRSCLIKHVLSAQGQCCPNCAGKYEIYLFNGFEPTVKSISLLEADKEDDDPKWLQPFSIQSGGFIPNGGRDQKTRGRVRLEKKSDKWGGDNDEAKLAQEAQMWAEQQARRVEDWRQNLQQTSNFFEEFLTRMNDLIEDVDDFLVPFTNMNEQRAAKQALDEAHGTWKEHEAPLANLEIEIAAETLYSLQHDENGEHAQLVNVARIASDGVLEIEAELERVLEKYDVLMINMDREERRRRAEEVGDLFAELDATDRANGLRLPSPD